MFQYVIIQVIITMFKVIYYLLPSPADAIPDADIKKTLPKLSHRTEGYSCGSEFDPQP